MNKLGYLSCSASGRDIIGIGRCRFSKKSSGHSIPFRYSFSSTGLQCSENEWRTNGRSRVNNSRFHKTPLSTQRIEVARRVTLPSELDWNTGNPLNFQRTNRANHSLIVSINEVFRAFFKTRGKAARAEVRSDEIFRDLSFEGKKFRHYTF